MMFRRGGAERGGLVSPVSRKQVRDAWRMQLEPIDLRQGVETAELASEETRDE